MNNHETKQAAENMRELARDFETLEKCQRDELNRILDALAAMETELADRDSRLADKQNAHDGTRNMAATYYTRAEAHRKAAENAEARIADLEQQLAAAQRSAEDARRDSARLDWLEKHGTFIEVGQSDVGTSRADIDAAVAARGAKKS